MSTRYLPDPEKTLLLVVDVQERLAPAMPTEILPGVLRNIRILIEMAREFDLKIISTEQYPKGLGLTVPEVKASLPNNAQPVEKIAFSCCRETSFSPAVDQLFGHHSSYDVILCGMETHVCVLQTALDLLSDGQRVFVAADATCSRAKLNWKLGLDLMQQAGAVIGSTEILTFGMLGTAGTERFKRISKLVK